MELQLKGLKNKVDSSLKLKAFDKEGLTIISSLCQDSIIKINEFEHKKNFEIIPNYPKLADKLIVTKGKDGCEYMEETFPVEEVSVKDVSGAGDTFLSGLVVEYIKTNEILT